MDINRDEIIEKYKSMVKEARSIYPNPKYKELLDEARSIFWQYRIKTKERKEVIPLFGEIIKLEQEAHKKKRQIEKELIEQRKALKRSWRVR